MGTAKLFRELAPLLNIYKCISIISQEFRRRSESLWLQMIVETWKSAREEKLESKRRRSVVEEMKDNY